MYLFDLVKKVPTEVAEEGHCLLSPSRHDAPEVPAKINKVNVVLLLLAAMSYDTAVCGAVTILGVFVVKEPLSWTAAQVTPFHSDLRINNVHRGFNVPSPAGGLWECGRLRHFPHQFSGPSCVSALHERRDAHPTWHDIICLRNFLHDLCHDHDNILPRYDPSGVCFRKFDT